MKIVNFVRHSQPVKTGWHHKFHQIASFDVEMISDGAVILWVGWSVRKKGDAPIFLQGPRIDIYSSTRRGNAIVMKGIALQLFLTGIRQQLKTKYDIEVPLPEIRNQEEKRNARPTSKAPHDQRRTAPVRVSPA